MSKEEVVVTRSISDSKLSALLWEVYAGSFADTDNYCAEDQLCYDAVSFQEALTDEDYWKYVLLADGVPIGVSLLTNNLRKARIAYCNDRFLIKKYPNYINQGRFYYVTAICVLPSAQHDGLGIELLRQICQFIFDNKAMVAYDYSENKNPWLTALIQKVGKDMGWDVIELLLDKQVYTSLYYSHDGNPK